MRNQTRLETWMEREVKVDIRPLDRIIDNLDKVAVDARRSAVRWASLLRMIRYACVQDKTGATMRSAGPRTCDQTRHLAIFALPRVRVSICLGTSWPRPLKSSASHLLHIGPSNSIEGSPMEQTSAHDGHHESDVQDFACASGSRPASSTLAQLA